MNPGELRHRVAIQARTTTPDANGQPADDWATLLTVFAKIEPARAPAEVLAEAETPSSTHTVTMRYRSNITTRNRLVYAGRIFDIVSVIDPDERHFWLELGCVEGLNKG